VWLSYQFLFETTDDEGYTSFNKTGTLNTYTFCHEFSHVLGSDDYYDADTGYSTCLGGYDLMDNAFADHTAFNKILYGWITSSKLITTSSSVTLSLNDFETSGETLIVANSWDESLGMFQEYWIIEYYSNNGLNASLPGLFDEEGIIIHHINATLSYDSSYGMYDLAYSNASKSSKHNLISYVMNGNSYLFQAGDKVSTSTKDDKNKSIPYQISIDSLENGVATITFTKA
jgi:hypothetical protein